MKRRMLSLTLCGLLALGFASGAGALSLPALPNLPNIPLPTINVLPLPTPVIVIPPFTTIKPPLITLPPLVTLPPLATKAPIPPLGTLIPIPLPATAVPTAPPAPAPTAPPAPAPTAKPAAKPAAKPQSNAFTGAEMTSFGLYFEDFRPKLTEEWYMFTPIDLVVEGVLTYPLVAQNAWIVGSVTITIRNGEVTLDYQVLSGVTVQREFFTLAANLDSFQTLNPQLLAGQNMPLRTPINISQTFGEDRKVVLYLNNLVDFNTGLAGITAFDPEANRVFMQNLMGLLD